jgi:hypothetical protein
LKNFNNELFDELKVIKIVKSLDNCLLIKCGIKNALKTNPSNMCDIVQSLQQERVPYIMKLGSPSLFTNSNNAATTVFNSVTGISEIHYNPLFCKTLAEATQFDRINIVLVSIHELLHIHLYNQIVKLYQAHGKTLPIKKNFQQDFTVLLAEEQYCVETVPGKHDQHVIMGKKFVSDLATTLWEANGKIGTPDDYLWFAWQGLYEEGKTPEGYITKVKLDAMYQRFIDNVGLDKLNMVQRNNAYPFS